jgi:hypothetical protein
MIQIDPAYAGQQVGCPLCQGAMLLPPPEFFGIPTGFAAEQSPGYPPQGYPPETPPNLPQLGCPFCGGAFQVSPEMTGHQVGCPHCQNAVTIPDLFGGGPAGFAPPPPPPHPSFDVSQQSMQFIGLPPGMGGPEIPTGYAVSPMSSPGYAPPMEQSVPMGVPVGVPVGMAVAPETQQPQFAAPPSHPPPRDDRLPPQRPKEKATPPPSAERLDDPHMYPPGMRPKDAPAKKEQDRTEPERPRDDRFPPGMGRREAPEKRAEKRPNPKGDVEPAAPESPVSSSPAPKVDDLLPPGAAPSATSTVDALLPPGAAGSVTDESEAAVSRRSVVDTLLPPGAPADPAAMPTEQVALPDAPPPAPKPMPAAAPGRLVVPTPDGDYVTVENKEGVKTISSKGEEIEIRKLSPEERARRRRVKNAVMFTIGILLLAVVIFFMTRK